MERQVFLGRASGEIGEDIFIAWDADERNSICVLLGISGSPAESMINPRGAADFLKINAKNWFSFHSTTPSLG